MTPATCLDVRGDFPFLRRTYNGKPLLYFDNAATTQKPQVVIDRLQSLYATGIANVHRAVNFLCDEVTQAFEQSRQTAARFIGAHAREIIFVPGCTHGINLVCASLSRTKPPRVLTTTLEHHSNFLPWTRSGAVDFVPWDSNGTVDLDVFAQKLRLKPDLVAVAHASNFLGVVHPIEELTALCREHDVPILVDASQSIAHLPVDVGRVACDYLVFSGHKIYGPGGTGVLYASPRRLETLEPALLGGSMVKEVHAQSFTMNDIPHRFEAGTPNIEGVIGLGAALQYVSRVGYGAIAAHERGLLDRALMSLKEVPRVSIVSSAPMVHAAPVVTFQVDGLESGAVARALAARSNAIVRSGFHCAQPAHDQLGLGPTVRASFAIYNNTEEIDCLAETLRALTKVLH